jgi:uncharacterized protein YfaS (alpha-2-macroglobulin family)
MKPVIIIAIFGIAIVMAIGLLMIEIPTERIVSDIDKPTQNSIDVTTDKPSYSDGEIILVTVEVRELDSETPVSIVLFDPDGSVVNFSQVPSSTNGKFSTEFFTDDPLMDIAGTYTIKAQYGNADSASETTFVYTG